MEQDDFPKIGRNFKQWSDLDSCLPNLDLNIELFRRKNVWIASFVIFGWFAKGGQTTNE